MRKIEAALVVPPIAVHASYERNFFFVKQNYFPTSLLTLILEFERGVDEFAEERVRMIRA